MSVNNFHFKLDIEREDHIPKFRLKQYDTAIFYASLYKNGLPYHFENEQIKMFVKKADGTIVYQEDNITIQDDEVKINVKNQALTASGLTYAELELRSTSGQVTTATFLFEVREKVGSDKAIESITDICTLEKLDRYVGQAKKELDKFKQDLSKLEDLVANKDKLEGQNTEAKINVKELERVLEQANNIVSNEGKKVTGNNVITDSSNGYIQNLKLTGKTLFNIIPLNPSKWVLGGSGENLGVNAYYSIYLSDLPIKPNTTYSYKLFGLPQKCNSHWFHLTAPKITKSPEGTFTSLSEIGNSFLHLYPNGDQKFTLDDVKNVKVVLVEGNEKIDGYFEGIKSVGDGIDNIEIKSCNFNLFDENLLSSRLEADGYYHFRTTGNNNCSLYMGFVNDNYQQITDMTPNMVLDLSKFDLSNWKFLIGINGDVKDDKVLIPVEQIGYLNTSFFKGCEFIKVDNNHIKVKNIELSLNKTTTSYIPHEESKRNLLYYDSKAKSWKKPILKGIYEGVQDIIEKHSNGKIYYRKKCMEFTIKGSENWVFDGDVGDTIRCYLRNSNIRPGLVASDRFNSIQNYVLDKEHIYASDGLLWVFLNKSKATDLNTFKNYFKGTPTTVVCPMIKEEVYECLDISTRSFNPQTLFSVSSGAIDPGIEYYIPSSFVSSDSSISEKLENVDDSLLKLMFDFISHNHDKRYDLKNLGSVTDFNTALEPGRYYVFKEGGSIPNAPYSGNIYGALEVFHTNDTELIQRFTSANGKIYTRLKNFEGSWWTWSNMTNIGDFSWDFNNTTGTGFQKLPSGMIIQFGTTKIGFNDNSCIGTAKIYYPLAFTKFCKCTGNLETNSYGGYNETNAIVGGQTLTNGYAEVRDIQGRPRTGYTATVTWIAIGI
ncbi:BppU family phage baseplate upper protein [Paraclostridium sordellii]|uniref:BppU family phage baseplate upper protein n=1 Tax=Paraclostridium sordellii TaxID=1505 RepID=UPI0015F632B1|nr:BppU family phage baseplate upper protein [Paeniclostridium sordellii]